MKITGWIFTIIGIFSFLGCLLKGNGLTGPFFWLGLGVYLIHRSNQKEKEKENFDKWKEN